MESFEEWATHCRPSFIEGGDVPERLQQVDVDDVKANLSEKFFLVSPDVNQKNSLDSKEHLQVFLRVRPLTASELEQNESQDCVQMEDSTCVLVKAPSNSLAIRLSDKGYTQMIQRFTFSHIFGPETTQKEFFEGTVKELVNDFLNGRNRLIFTYGVSNAGKTHTFQGTPEDLGILPRSMNMMFNSIQNQQYTKMDLKPNRCRDYVRLTKDQVKKEIAIKNAVLRLTKEVESQNYFPGRPCLESMESIEGSLHSSVNLLSHLEEQPKESEQCDLKSSLVRFSIWVSFCEIYNECIYDLLEPISTNKSHKRKTLRLAQDIKGCSFVKDLQWIEVSDSKEAYKLLNLGKRCQSFASTKLNSSSSRSHSIFTFRMLRIEDADTPRVTKVSELSLCDLAGSERCTKTRNEGDRLKESGNINTSLLILGKCINALKNNQQAKLPQHVPFRESKLTHYLQSFFCGKGKACMIVNISQAASMYDETLNVLKFSAVAQKVLLLDTSKPLTAIPFGETKSSMDVSLLIDNADHKSWTSKKRATILWDSLLEDVIESEDDSVDTDEETEEETEDQIADTTLTDPSTEESLKKEEGGMVLAGKEYQKLLDLIEDLRKKLANETKRNLFMELKIRKEVAKEFTDQLMQKDHDFSECLKNERELLEERSDERMAIFQDLVIKCTKEPETAVEEIGAESSSAVAASQGEYCGAPIKAFIDSMQEDLSVIKERAVAAHLHIKAIPNNSENVATLEKRLLGVTAELSRIQEELTKKTQDLEMHVNNLNRCTTQLDEANEKITKQSSRIEELMCIVNEKDIAVLHLEELLSQYEERFENYDKAIRDMKGEMLGTGSAGIEAVQSCVSIETSARRKRAIENPIVDEQPPAKKGTEGKVCTMMTTAQEKIEICHPSFPERDSTLVEMHDKLEVTQGRIIGLADELQGKGAENSKLRADLTHMQQLLSCSEQNASALNEEVQQLKVKCEKLISEFEAQNKLNKEQEVKISELITEVEGNKLNLSEKVSQIKNIQVKIDMLGREEMEMKFLDLEDSMQGHSVTHNKMLLSEVSTLKAEGRGSTFHCVIENLWKGCQHVAKVSTNKSLQIKKLEEQFESLREQLEKVTLENSHLKLKLSEAADRGKLQNEEEKDLVEQLRKQLSDYSNLLDVEKQCILQANKKLSDFEKERSGYEEKVKELDCLVKTLENKNNCVEKLLFDKKTVIEEFQQRSRDSENTIKTLTDKEIGLQEELKGVQNKLRTLQHSHEDQEKQNENLKQESERLRKELEHRSAQEQTLRLDLERTNEDYSDLKEKLADAKKQIQQVEKEVSTMREEKKLMTNKLNECEKIKNQMILDLDMKQRTIQLLKKEQMDNEKMSSDQTYCAELKAKEKLIEDMRMTLLEQEQTQAEQDRALEAKTEEVVKLVTELEELKHSCRVLENINLGHESHVTENEKSNTNLMRGELYNLKETLKECEEKHNNDRKKWMEEKVGLLNQAKEAEIHRNQEMRKFAADRERHLKQQTEIETLSAQLSVRDKDLQKWREERDQLVAALEVQLKNLVSSNIQKDEEIQQLNGKILRNTEMESTDMLKGPVSRCRDRTQDVPAAGDLDTCSQSAVVPLGLSKAEELVSVKQAYEEPPNREMHAPGVPKSCGKPMIKKAADLSSHFSEASSIDDSEDHSDVALDSSALSTENGKTSRFPKPLLEIQFTPLTPNKMEVKHQGSASPVTIKINRNLRKRKSQEINEGIVKTENNKNTTPRPANSPFSVTTTAAKIKKETINRRSSLKKQISTSSTLSARKKDGTLQKIGDLLHSSPAIFQNKAKKLMETISATKSAGDGSVIENQAKPKRSRRKLYTTDISAPMDFPSLPMIMDNNAKESDHLIMKRRLRAKTAK